jgi:hypothetical protein
MDDESVDICRCVHAGSCRCAGAGNANAARLNATSSAVVVGEGGQAGGVCWLLHVCMCCTEDE